MSGSITLHHFDSPMSVRLQPQTSCKRLQTHPWHVAPLKPTLCHVSAWSRATDRACFTAIHVAVQRNHSHIVQLLMDGGCSPDVADTYGLTPLWWAGYFGHKDCVEILFSRGADPLYERTQSDKNYPFYLTNGVSCDDSPLAVATNCNHCDIVTMMHMQVIINVHRSVASAGGETTATMTDVSLTCQVQQLTSEVCSLTNAVQQKEVQLAQKDAQIHSLETTVKDMSEKLVLKDRQISSIGKSWVHLRRSFDDVDQQLCHMVSLADTLSSCVTGLPGSVIGNRDVTSHHSVSLQCGPSHSLDPQHVLSVVQQQSSCRWYPLGRAMGLSSDQLHMFATRFVFDCDKLQAVFDEKAREVGEVPAGNTLLQACRSIQNPTIGAIEQELKKQCGCSSV